MTSPAPKTTPAGEPRLTSLSHGGGCGCKVAPALLSEILSRSGGLPVPQELLIGSATSDDAAVWRLNESQALVATTDFFMPIVDDPFDFGRIAATNAISDVYAMGGTPILALALVGMPVNVLSPATIARILEGGASVCAAAGIPVAGGHTIDSVEAIYGLVALGIVHPDQVKANAGARPGDLLVLGKPLGVGIFSAALKKGLLPEGGYAAMIESMTRLNTPGADLVIDWDRVPVLAGAMDLAAAGHVTGASGRNWASYGADIALPDGFAAPARALLTDPQTSGGLLVACAPEALPEVQEVFARHGHLAAGIGHTGAASDRPQVQVVQASR